jgi:hypothetical protein
VLDSMLNVWTHERQRPKTWTGQPVRYRQVKYDGHRVTFFQQPPTSDNGLCVFGSKLEAELELSHHLEQYPFYQKLARVMRGMSSVDGELHVPGKPASYVKSAIVNGDPRLTFTAFAVPWWNGDVVTSMTMAQHIVERVCYLEFARTAPLPERYYGGLSKQDAASAAESLATIAKDGGIEGYVLKEDAWENWYKVKHSSTVDCVVMDLKPGKGKYAGMCGALHVGVFDAKGELKEIACVSGMSDDVRAEIERNRIGRVVEVEYDRLDAKGRLRFPRFVRFRDDKRGLDCTWKDQLPMEEEDDG